MTRACNLRVCLAHKFWRVCAIIDVWQLKVFAIVGSIKIFANFSIFNNNLYNENVFIMTKFESNINCLCLNARASGREAD